MIWLGASFAVLGALGTIAGAWLVRKSERTLRRSDELLEQASRLNAESRSIIKEWSV